MDRWKRTTRECSNCHEKIEVNGDIMKCTFCSLEMNRDLNAAKNILRLGVPLDEREFKPLEAMLDLSKILTLTKRWSMN